MSCWTNRYAIKRDLSMVQGRVPAAVDETLTSGDKPPQLTLNEETEEEFIRHFAGEGDVGDPDFGLIKQMLNMVRHVDVSSNVEEDPGTVIQISKLDPTTPEFTPRSEHQVAADPEDPETSPEIIKKRKQLKKKENRNVALNSIRELSNSTEKEKQTQVLLKPSDFTCGMKESTKKVNGWFDAQETHNSVLPDVLKLDQKTQKINTQEAKSSNIEKQVIVPNGKKDIFAIDPSAMFKRKNASSKIKKETPVQPTVKSVESTQKCMKYIPSSRAEEYYQRLIEKKKKEEMAKEDIWSRAERQMREIEEKRKIEAEQSKLSRQTSDSTKSLHSCTSEPSIATGATYTISGNSSVISELNNIGTDPSANVTDNDASEMSYNTESAKGFAEISTNSNDGSKMEGSEKEPIALWELSAAEDMNLVVVRLPRHRHAMKGDCKVCQIREHKDRAIIHVVDCEDKRIFKSCREDIENAAVTSWRNFEELKTLRYDHEQNKWYEKEGTSEEESCNDEENCQNDDNNISWRQNEEIALKKDDNAELSWRKKEVFLSKSEKIVSNSAQDDVGSDEENIEESAQKDNEEFKTPLGDISTDREDLDFCSLESLSD